MSHETIQTIRTPATIRTPILSINGFNRECDLLLVSPLLLISLYLNYYYLSILANHCFWSNGFNSFNLEWCSVQAFAYRITNSSAKKIFYFDVVKVSNKSSKALCYKSHRSVLNASTCFLFICLFNIHTALETVLS